MGHCHQDLVFSATYSVYSFVFLVFLIYNLCSKKTRKTLKSKKKALLWLNISVIVFVFCQFCSMTAHSFNYAFFCVGGISTTQQMIFSAIEIFPYIGLQLFFNILITLRLYFTFSHSVYQLKNKTLYLIISFIIILSMIHIISLLMQCLYFIHFNPFIIMILTIINSSLNCVLEITIITIFIHKLFLLTVSLNSFTENGNNDNNDSNGNRESVNNLDNKQLSLLTTITKQSLLNILAISLQFIKNIILIIDMKVSALNHSLDVEYHYIVHEVRWTIVSLIILCIFMTYSFSSKLYYLLCGKCHKCCYKCCWKFGFVRVSKNKSEHSMIVQAPLL